MDQVYTVHVLILAGFIFSRISAELITLIYEHANMFDNNRLL